jgi:hypothetical protein
MEENNAQNYVISQNDVYNVLHNKYEELLKKYNSLKNENNKTLNKKKISLQ